MTSAIETSLKRYAISEALFRGTGLLSNLLSTALIAMSPTFGPLGILGSTLIQVLSAALLEVPSGWLADRFGWKQAIFFGLTLKILVTITFAGAIFAAHADEAALAWGLLVAESIIDAFAAAFLSGSVEASYEKWFIKEIGEESYKKYRPMIFLDSFKYGLKTRLGIPIFGIALSGLLILKNSETNNIFISTNDSALILAGMIGCRFLVIFRTSNDLKLLKDNSQETLAHQTFHNSSNIMPTLIATAPELFAYALGGFLYVAVGMYLVGEAFYTLKELTQGNVSSTWYLGQILGLTVNLVVILASRFVFPKFSGKTHPKKIAALYTIAAAIFFICAIVLIISGVSWTGFSVLTLFSILGIIAGTYLQRLIASQLSSLIPENQRATWLSIGQSLAYFLFALHGVVLMLSESHRLGPVTVMFSSAVLCALWGASTLNKKYKK